MKLKHRLYDIGDQLESMAQQARAEKYQGVAGVSFGVAEFRLSVPELLGTFLTRGRYDFGKFDLVVPDNVRTRIVPQIPEQRTRWSVWQGVPTVDAGRFVNLIADLISGAPTIPWVELSNEMDGGRIRIEPWKDIEFELTY